MHTALTIAGSDSSGGAGIQADLRTFAAHGVFGTSAITAVTAQNTMGVRSWLAMPAELVLGQIDAVVSDIGANAVKIGMLANAGIVRTVAEAARTLHLQPIVLDPVMIAKSGDRLLEPEAIEALRDDLLPLVHLVTPNIPEAEVLAGRTIISLDDMRDAGQRLLELGARAALIKGGHAGGPDSIDVLCTAGETHDIRGPRLPGRHTHGTGCTLASAIAANLARGQRLQEAVEAARHYLEGAIRFAPRLGQGHGPLNHMWRLY
jgi:hydroxymethylpyrimidine/phosphomethylpyrimidine kinase